MLQKEVVERLAASPGEKNYGRLSIMAQYFCQVENLFEVPPECFIPAPKVDSAIVRLVPHKELPVKAHNMARFETLVKTAFAQRRKTLRNSLKSFEIDFSSIDVKIDLAQRAENLSLEQYVNLSNALWPEE